LFNYNGQENTSGTENIAVSSNIRDALFVLLNSVKADKKEDNTNTINDFKTILDADIGYEDALKNWIQEVGKDGKSELDALGEYFYTILKGFFNEDYSSLLSNAKIIKDETKYGSEEWY